MSRGLTFALCALLVAGCGGNDTGARPDRDVRTAPEPASTVGEAIEQISDERSLDGIEGLETCEVELEGEGESGLECGTNRDDRIEGFDGEDIIVGMGGDDVLYASMENDATIDANARNVVSGGAGNDFIVDAFGPGLLFGGAGNDLILAIDPAAELVDCGAGRDRVEVSSVGDQDTIVDCEVVTKTEPGALTMEAFEDRQRD